MDFLRKTLGIQESDEKKFKTWWFLDLKILFKKTLGIPQNDENVVKSFVWKQLIGFGYANYYATKN